MGTNPPVDSDVGTGKLQEPSTTPITKGLHVGEYLIEEKIGAGGMGEVYRAVHPVIGKHVAVKILANVHSRNANVIRRFVLEARSVNEIRHPNLVDIFSFGQLTDGRYYYAMEYLEGRSLGVVLRERGPLRPEEVLPVFLDVLSALEAAHAKGVVHRDLKPDNVFLLADGNGTLSRTKLLDFGLAKLLESNKDEDPVTAAGMAVGTPHYMAPEQCLAKKVDGRTDLYALGIMLYEALTGYLPFTGHGTVEIWEGHVRKMPRPPRALMPDHVSVEVDALILKLLAKSPDKRFQTAAEVTKALSAQIPRRTEKMQVSGGEGASRGSISAVGRAMPSSVKSEDLIGIEEKAAPVQAVALAKPNDARELREILDLEIQIAEPAAASKNPSQVSALNIDLGALQHVEVEPLSPLAAPSTNTNDSSRLVRLRQGSARIAESTENTGMTATRSRTGKGVIVGIVIAVLAVAGAILVLLR